MDFLDPGVESASRDEIVGIQLERLKLTLSLAGGSRMYQHKFSDSGVGLGGVGSLEDLSTLPFTTKEDLRSWYPFGAVPVDLDDLALFVHSSGTTGKVIGIYHTQRDLEDIARIQSRSYYGTGIRKKDRVQLMISPVAGYSFTRSLHRLGAFTVFTGSGNPKGQVDIVKDLGISVVFGLPSFLMHLSQRYPEVCDSSVNRIISLGEPLTRAMRERLEVGWGAEVYSVFGSTELGAGFAECCKHDGHHVPWDAFIIETVDPESGEPTRDAGEMVFTTLCREGTPLIRYRTGDLVRIVHDVCGCGRTNPRVLPEGRLGEMLKVKGTALYPSVLREHLTSVSELSGFQVVVDKDGSLDRLILRVETNREGSSTELETRLAELVKSVTGITPVVEFLPRNTLNPSSGKAKQFLDLRP